MEKFIKKNSLLVLLLILGMTPLALSSNKNSTNILFENGRTDYVIAVEDESHETVLHAAGLLQDYLHKVSGVRFPIVANSLNYDKRISLVIANCNLDGTKDFLENDDSFSVISDGNNIKITANNDKSLLHAVYAFLEKSFGCKWYTSSIDMIPALDEFKFNRIDIKYKPQIRFRSVDYFDSWKHEMAIPNRLNCQFHGPVQSKYVDMLWLEHSFDVFIPADQYFDSHPEYFSYFEGKRHKKRSQLCLSNKDVLKKTIAGLREYIADNPHFKIYNVAQNDNQNYCRCQECSKIAADYGGQSGLMIWFVNQVADAVKDDHPDKYIGTFAYQYTRLPPKNIKPRRNVAIILCSIECDFSHSFTHQHNAKFLEDLDSWKKVTTNILIWDYVVNYRHYLIPHPNFNILETNIKLLRDAGVLGILEQANGQSLGSEFYGLRAYLLAKLLQDPNCDARAVIEDYINSLFGSSAKYILAYFDLVQSLVNEETFLSFAARTSNPIFTKAFIQQADKFLSMAEKAASNETILNRVKLVKLQVIYLKMTTELVDSDKDKLLEEFIEITKRANVTWVSEGMTTKKFIELFKKT